MEFTNYKQRIDAVIDYMDEGIAVIPGASLVNKSNDTSFPFRQNSHFFIVDLHLMPYSKRDLLITNKLTAIKFVYMTSSSITYSIPHE